jgi:predicted PurR-regulated permease PerM
MSVYRYNTLRGLCFTRHAVLLAALPLGGALLGWVFPISIAFTFGPLKLAVLPLVGLAVGMIAGQKLLPRFVDQFVDAQP